MILDFVKMSPAENMTVFVMNKLNRTEYINISNSIMKESSIGCEQVGFIEESSKGIRLQMMGGEFCGNASRSFAAYMVFSDYPNISQVDGTYFVPLEVSGLDKEIMIEVRKSPWENKFYSSIFMPLPIRITEEKYFIEESCIKTTRVDFPGITHFIVDQDIVNDPLFFFNLLKRNMDKETYDAFGIMYYDSKNNFLTPLVYVKDTDSLIWERSCASGTCALGVAMAYPIKEGFRQNIYQPGGSLEVQVEVEDNKTKSVSLDGLVEIVAEGKLYI